MKFIELSNCYELSRLVGNMLVVLMLPWYFSASFEACNSIFLPGCIFFGYFFGKYFKGDKHL